MSVAIKIEDVSKLYRLGVVGTGTISHDLNRWWHRVRGKEDPYAKVGQVNDRTATSDEKRETSKTDRSAPLATRRSPLATSSDYVWALKDINLEVAQGEILGIIGRNGAGKSTLLKLLSRVTAPTTGDIKVRGRIASLLEVGTGFHPELTGRENVFLNGTILGMSKREVDKQLDAIVDFAGVEKYIDTPVKRYSSGMTVRLGFAVAAHLDPEILIVDEVLAVGDIEFQKRCLGKMQDIAGSGKAILFVSHNLTSISNLTSSTIVLSQGQIIFEGPTDQGLRCYVQENLAAMDSPKSIESAQRPFAGLDRELEFADLKLEGSTGTKLIILGEFCRLIVTIRAKCKCDKFSLGLTVYSDDKTPVGSTFSVPLAAPEPGTEGSFELQARFPLAPGEYHCGISISSVRSGGKHLHDSLSDVLPFEVASNASEMRDWHAGWGMVAFPTLEQGGS